MEYKREVQSTQQRSYGSSNYKGKNPMSCTQWRREQRRRKAERKTREKATADSDENKPTKYRKNVEKERERRLKLFELANFEDEVKGAENEEDMLTDNFNVQSDPSLDIACNAMFVMLKEYDQITEVEEPDTNMDKDMARHKPVCYYVMNNDYVEEHNAFFERPDAAMKGI